MQTRAAGARENPHVALRLLELTIPAADLDRVPSLCEGLRTVQVWDSSAAPTTGLVRILIEAQDAEALSDVFVRAFGADAAFRLTLFPVEATVPAVVEPEPSAPPAAAPGQPAARRPRIGREELYEDISQASRTSGVYLAMVAISTVVAALGLIRGDVAIIIGAMVIAPLLGPNIALSLAATLGDTALARRSLRAIGAGVALAAGLSLLLGAVLAVDPSAHELAARTQPRTGDIVLALGAGAAGALAFTSGVPAVVVGVMVAVALLPPLVAAGLLAGAGFGRQAWGAVVLMLTNLTCVNLAAVATFLAQRVRPRTWWEADRARRATRIAMTTWAVMLAALIALILYSGAAE